MIETGTRVTPRSAAFNGAKGTIAKAVGQRLWKVIFDDGEKYDGGRGPGIFGSCQLKRLDEAIANVVDSSDDEFGQEDALADNADNNSKGVDDEGSEDNEGDKDDSFDNDDDGDDDDDDNDDDDDDDGDDDDDDDNDGDDDDDDDDEDDDDGDNGDDEDTEDGDNNAGGPTDEDDLGFEFWEDVFDDPEDVDDDLHSLKTQLYEEEKAELIGKTFEVKASGRGGATYVWKVVEDSHPDEVVEEFPEIGLRGFDGNNPSATPCNDAFWILWPGTGTPKEKRVSHTRNLNAAIKNANAGSNGKHKKTRKVALVSEKEFVAFVAIVIFAGTVDERGDGLWKVPNYKTVTPIPTVKELTGMSLTRFNDIKPHFFSCFISGEEDTSNPWFRADVIEEAMNANRVKVVAAGHIKVLDESMSSFRPRTSKTGNLPHISYIMRKPRPLGTEDKNGGDAATNMLCGSGEIQKGKAYMQEKKYVNEFGATAACTLRLIDSIANSGQRPEDHRPNLFLMDSWFASAKVASEISKRGHNMIGVVKTAHSRTPKAIFEKEMEEWPGGSYLVAMCTEPGTGVELVFTGYKYCSRKVVCFIATKNAGSTQPDASRPYVAKFLDGFFNVKSRNVDRPAIISTYFENSNVIDRHNQLRQGELGLEDKWVTQDGFFRYGTTKIGQTVTDAFNAVKFSVKGRNPLKNVSIKQFAGILCFDMLRMMDLEDDPEPGTHLVPLSVGFNAEDDTRGSGTVDSPISLATSDGSTASCSSETVVTVPFGCPVVPEYFRKLHHMRRTTQRMSDGNRLNRKSCKNAICTSKSEYYCVECEKFFCLDGTKGRDCFYDHICNLYAKTQSGRSGFDSEFMQAYRVYQSYKRNS